MSGFGSGGGFGGFGQNNNQQSTGFGFGQTANTNTGFGASTNTGFGAAQNNTGGGLFGGSSGGFGNTGGFGNSGGAFGSTANKAPAFGSGTTGGGLFGSTTAPASTGFGSGGFGASTNTGFGASNNTTGGLFGATKPATGFGASAAPTTTFGAPAASTGFGASAGFGAAANVSQDCPGTAQVPFQPHQEKEGNVGNAQVKYENISTMENYKRWSPEELRLADYAQGRRHASGGQAGAFGQSTGFGGFGNNQQTTPAFGATPSTGTSLFGNTASNTTSNPFGQAATTNTGFGASSNTGGGLFGSAQKPATGGLFGSTTTGTGFGAAAPSTGFGATTNTGFGAGASNTTSLFGNNTSNKPSLFGSTPAASTGFGTNTGTTGFGASANTNPFGQTAQNTAANPFGATSTTQPATTANAFGSGFGQNNTSTTTGGLFGAPKPATGGLFGNTAATPAATGGGLFGNNNSTTNTGFGAQPAASNTGGGLFGAKTAAPATGGGLFGNTAQPATGATSGGLFGTGGGFGATQNNNQPAASGGLFGNLNNTQQQQPKSLFGASQPAQSGGLFGNNTAQQNTGGTTGGLFGNSTFGNTQNQAQQQNTGGGLFSGGNSLFGNSQQTAQQPQQQQQQQVALTTSINDPAAFGSSMFSQLAAPDQTNPGPLATPLSSLNKQKKAGLLPLYKMSPQSGSRLNTPQKRGFGFSYSTYGSPGSLTSTPGTYSNSVLGTNRGQTSMIKSVSTSNLRNSFHSSFNREDSILAPGAFTASPGSKYSSTGSMKKLVINRGIRSDLFTPPAKTPKTSENGLKKRVSFEAPETNGNASATSPLKQVQTADGTPTAQDMGFLRSSTSTAATDSPKSNGAPEMEQVKGNELAIVPEEDAPTTPAKIATSVSNRDKVMGEYWISPSMEELKSMNRTQLQSVENFSVGREGVGSVHFIPPVDLTRTDLDNFLNKIVVLETRSATVYPEGTRKPPRGKELNVPTKIVLENSWPRLDMSQNTPDKVERQLVKHVRRLKKVKEVTFLDYDAETGTWTFRVEHFTTYGLNYDSEDDEDMTEADMERDLTPGPNSAEPLETPTYVSPTESERVDDTFDFKKRKVFPGAFDMSGAIEDDAGMQDNFDNQERQSFLDERSAGSLSGDVDEPMDHDDAQGNELVRVESNEMAGSFPQPDATVELENQYAESDSDNDTRFAGTRGGLSRSYSRSMHASGTPLKKKVQFADVDDGNWASMLQQTISPMKRDRADLKRVREEEEEAARSGSPMKPASMVRNRVVSEGHGFATSIDLMHSLFGESKSPAKVAKVNNKQKSIEDGFKWPYNKARKTVDESMDAQEQAYHDSVKPHWGPDSTLIYGAPDDANSGSIPDDHNSLLSNSAIIKSDRDIRISKFADMCEAGALRHQKSISSVNAADVAPSATLTMPFKFKDFITKNETGSMSNTQENLVWELASILFDEIEIPDDLANFPAAFKFLRKDLLSAFWEKLVEPSTAQKMTLSKSPEEKAVAALAGHRIVDACKSLTAGKDFHLATLVALVDGNESTRESIQEQLEIWRDSRALSEINQPIRAIYEILAGNVCVCEGSKKGAPIEDRLDTFTISERFGLDWRQAFGLRLWYASSNMGELKEAVRKYADDLASQREAAKPVAWYVEANISPLWDDQLLEDRENLLWGLLKLYADDNADLQSVIRPENSQLSPFNMRLTWQLGQALTASGKCSFGADAEQKADSATLAFAQQLTAEGQWLDAIFVLLHLTDAQTRAKTIQDHLARHAGKIGAPDSTAFVTLVETYKLPATWVWSAKALYMRAVVKDAKKEVECLIQAKAYNEAHRTLCKEVAPIAIIERDYDTLKGLLAGFEDNCQSITDWELGGGIYIDYLRLLEQQNLSHANPLAVQVAERLIKTLPVMVAAARAPSFSEKVAAQEMSGIVAEVLVHHGRVKTDKSKALDHSKILRLPLTEDRYLKHTADLSLDYYRNLLMGTAH